MKNNKFSKSDLIKFEKLFDIASEDKALHSRGNFVKSFPIKRIPKLTLDEYVIGKGTDSFCALAEAKSRSWANIQGATASKFGIYYGKKGDNKVDYRPSKKFGEAPDQAFSSIKHHLLELLEAGKNKEFKEIDSNPISQMFKAKLLSLYFPELYLNVCSSEHIELLANELGIFNSSYVSENQHLLFEEKLKNGITKNWSNPKFMSFLYAKFIREELEPSSQNHFIEPRKKARRKVNFDDINRNRDLIGKLSEDFALNWEKNRLAGLGHEDLAEKIVDRRDTPSYGYDFLSYNAPGQERYIEVKSVGRDRKESCYRFFLSENELSVSRSDECSKDYFFYLVFYNKDGQPVDLITKHAKDVFSDSEIAPCAYIVRFDKD